MFICYDYCWMLIGALDLAYSLLSSTVPNCHKVPEPLRSKFCSIYLFPSLYVCNGYTTLCMFVYIPHWLVRHQRYSPPNGKNFSFHFISLYYMFPTLSFWIPSFVWQLCGQSCLGGGRSVSFACLSMSSFLPFGGELSFIYLWLCRETKEFFAWRP